MSKLSSSYREVLAGLTTSFALVPESLAFALVAHLNPLMGLYGAAIICALTAALGGRPGMISGAAGSMAVVIIALVVSHGAQYLLATVVLGGVLMIAFGALRLASLIRMVPHPVMLGFVNGLAIIIAMAQLDHFKVHTASGEQWLHGSALGLMLGLTAATMLVVYVLPKLTRRLPPALVAIVGMAVLCSLFQWPARQLGDLAHIAGDLPRLHWPQVPWNLATLRIIGPYAVLMALVGLLETLLTLRVTQEITGTDSQPNRECLALGAANITSGLLGGMGGCAMIGQTMINLGSGGRGRLSGLICGVMIMLYIIGLSPLIERIPLAALAGVMFVVAQQTFAWASLRQLGRIPLSDAVVIVAVTAITVWTDLAIAVLCGVMLSALSFAWQQAGQVHAHRTTFDGHTDYRLGGILFFASTDPFLALFQLEHDAKLIRLDCQHLQLVGQSAMAALETLQQRCRERGQRLQLVGLSAGHMHLLRHHPDLDLQ
ncbi:SulP family inorganic anion transporter [Frateuria aurantia]